MSISKLSMSSPLKSNFKARTTINAPEHLLSKEDRKKLIEQGKKIGTDSDTIDINVSELQDSDRDPDVKFYNISESYNLTLRNNEKYTVKANSSFVYSSSDKLYEKNLPKYIIGKHLDNKIKFGLDKE